MKKNLPLTLLLFVIVSITSYAQTYCFKAIEVVQNGVKSKGSGTYTYFTFQNDMNRFYISDADGYAGSMPIVYNLVSTANNRYKYQQQGPMGPIGNYYTFNSDFTRANATSSFMPNYVTVWQLSDGAQTEEEEFY